MQDYVEVEPVEVARLTGRLGTYRATYGGHVWCLGIHHGDHTRDGQPWSPNSPGAKVLPPRVLEGWIKAARILCAAYGAYGAPRHPTGGSPRD